MLSHCEVVEALRRTAQWVRSEECEHEKCRGIFWRNFNGLPGLSAWSADQWCAHGRFIYECGAGAVLANHEGWLGGAYAATVMEQLFDAREYERVALMLERRAELLEAEQPRQLAPA